MQCNEPDGEKRWWSCLTFYTSYQNLPCTCTAQYPIPPVKVWMPKDRCASGLFASKVPRPTEERIWTDGTGTTQRATAGLLIFSLLPCRPILLLLVNLGSCNGASATATPFFFLLSQFMAWPKELWLFYSPSPACFSSK